MRQLTPSGAAGVAVVAAAGDEAARLRSCLRSRSGGAFVPDPQGGPRIAQLRLDGELLDEVLVVERPDRLEVHLHGAPAVLDALRAEFPDLTTHSPSDPAHRLLREALGVEQVDLALEQANGSFPAFLAGVAAAPPSVRGDQIEAAIVRSRVALAQVEPQRLVLVGAQNAGKSTFFNRLLHQERVLVGALPGLTRDPVAEVTMLGGYPYVVVDTAGEGRPQDPVDAAAQQLGRRQRAGAILLLVVDASIGLQSCDRALLGPGVVVVANKVDLPVPAWPAEVPCHLRVSARNEESGAVRTRVGECLRKVRGLPPAGPVGGAAALDRDQLQALLTLRTTAQE